MARRECGEARSSTAEHTGDCVRMGGRGAKEIRAWNREQELRITRYMRLECGVSTVLELERRPLEYRALTLSVRAQRVEDGDDPQRSPFRP